jgi:hypothetical protein
MSIKSSFAPINLLSHDDTPNLKPVRYPFTDAAPEVLAKMQVGYLVKFNAGLTAVLPALAADDAVLAGIIADLPDIVTNPTDTTVAIYLRGSFNIRQIHYANAWSQGASPTALSAAAITRLRSIEIFLDPSVPTGPPSP